MPEIGDLVPALTPSQKLKQARIVRRHADGSVTLAVGTDEMNAVAIVVYRMHKCEMKNSAVVSENSSIDTPPVDSIPEP